VKVMGNKRMGPDDGWPRVWAGMSDEELQDRLRHYLFLANGPNRHARRIVQLVAEAGRRGKARCWMRRCSGSTVTNRRNKSSLQ
jgi:hypothetical protein